MKFHFTCIVSLSEKLTTGGWTTDNSALEKLRCLSAGGAKKGNTCQSVNIIVNSRDAATANISLGR